jgi:threonine synthase
VIAAPRPAASGGEDHSFAHLPTGFVCHGCGERCAAAEPVPSACLRSLAGDDVDHVLVRTLDPHRVRFPAGDAPNPFVRFRELFHAWHVARALGWPDERYVALVEELDAGVARLDGRGFAETPLVEAPGLRDAAGLPAGVILLVKDETGNVSGSHKARHLMGTALELELGDELRRVGGGLERGAVGDAGPARLAIASCGNAALAAAVVARAWDRDLLVFVPPEAPASILRRLRELGAAVRIVERRSGEEGDPTVHALRRAVADGAIPFTCQGSDNGFAIEGGLTLAYELVGQLAATHRRLDRLFVQVGGGALASSCAQGLAEAHALGALDAIPRLHAVQAAGNAPLVRAYDLVCRRLASRLGLPVPSRDAAGRAALAGSLQGIVSEPTGAGELARVPHHRSAFMWPWDAPASVAGGILDDETYDWYAVVRGLLESGGWPIVVDDERLLAAADLARATTGIDVDATGAAGLAGLLEAAATGAIHDGETVAVLFTGIRRDEPPTEPTAPPGEPR